MVEFTYSWMNHILQSDQQWPEFGDSVNEGSQTIRICKGLVSEDLANPGIKGVRFQGNREAFLLIVDRVARYLARCGEVIEITPVEGVESSLVRSFVFGKPLAALMAQRGELVLRGTAIVVDGKGVLLTGAEGSGRSTLAVALAAKGAKILADGVVGVKDGVIQPHRAPLQLWGKAMRQLGLPLDEDMAVRQGLGRYRYELGELGSMETVPLWRAYYIEAYQRELAVSADDDDWLPDVLAASNYIYSCELVEAQRAVERLANSVALFVLNRPHPYPIDETADCLWRSIHTSDGGTP